MKLLLIECDDSTADTVARAVKAEWPSVDLKRVYSLEELSAEVMRHDVDVVVTDYDLGCFTGVVAYAIAKAHDDLIPFIFYAATGSDEAIVTAYEMGAHAWVPRGSVQALIVNIRLALCGRLKRQMARETDDRLREYDLVLNHANDAIVRCELNLSVSWMNQAGQKLFGPFRQSDPSRHLSTVLDEQTAFEVISSAAASHSEHEVWETSLTFRNRPPKPSEVVLRMVPVKDGQARTNGWLLLFRDISSEKRLEEKLAQAQRMENAGVVAAGVAHDMNNMLQPILMGVPMLRLRTNDPVIAETLTTFEGSATRCADLAKQILEFASGKTGARSLVTPKAVLRETASIVTHSFPASIQLRFDTAKSVWPVRVQLTQILQVLINLCVNARDAMPAGGDLWLYAENKSVSLADADKNPGPRPGNYVMLTVQDTGSGISPELRERIWEPFFTSKGETKGTGLGLSTALGIVKAHGGYITVQSAVNKGTSFFVYLPAANEPQKESRTDAKTTTRGSGELILVVDDDPAIKTLTSDTLERRGYRCMGANSGHEALEVFHENEASIRLVITDVLMPDLDGTSLIHLLREHHPDLPVIATSGNNDVLQGIEVALKNEEPIQTLAKPYRIEDLTAAVWRAISKPAPQERAAVPGSASAQPR